MEQLVIDIASNEDAELIKELLKKFKGVDVSSFSLDITQNEIQSRIEQGIADADNGRTSSWEEVKAKLLNKIDAKKG